MSDAPIRHGTYAGYQRHHKLGVDPCGPCLQAMREHGRKLHAKINAELAALRKRPLAGEPLRWHEDRLTADLNLVSAECGCSVAVYVNATSWAYDADLGGWHDPAAHVAAVA